MLPQTRGDGRNQNEPPHESIGDIHGHTAAMRQLFLPTSESRRFTREDAAKAFSERLLPADDRIQVGNKTGTDEEKQPLKNGVKGHVRADAAIVTGPDLTYVIAIYARQVEDTRWSVDNEALTTGARISRMVFDHFSRNR